MKSWTVCPSSGDVAKSRTVVQGDFVKSRTSSWDFVKSRISSGRLCEK